MKKYLLLFIVVFFTKVNAQLLVNNTTQTPAELVQNVLLGNGITVSNITYNGSALNANLIRDQVGYFQNGSSTNIGIDSGIILATGRAQLAIGPNNGNLTMTNPTANPIQGDPDLELLTSSAVLNKAILEFDFIPLGQNLSFNFVFGSEEYPLYANSGFNDVFGFFLSGPGLAGPFSGGAVNIALIPTSPAVPITINNLNNGTTNNGPCEYCSFYVNNNNTGQNPNTGLSTIEYNGFTTVIAALANVQCGMTYHIKLAIANVGDNSLDSAVFLQANSFNTSPINFPTDYLVSTGNAPCNNASIPICTGLAATVLHEWTLNGTIIPGTGPCITVTQPGNYCATAYPYGPACPITDCITIEYLPPMPVNPPIDLFACPNDNFNLSLNTPIVLGTFVPDTITYYTSLLDATNINFPISPANLLSFNGTNGQQIWVRVDDNNSCVSIQSFFLQDQICNTTPNTVPNLTLCDDISNNGIENFNFSAQTAIALGANLPADYTITYHLTQADADADVGAINPITSFNNTTNPQFIFIRMELNANPNSFGTTSFQLIVSPNSTPTFNPVAPICSGQTLSPLPTTSLNGINGVWTPVLNNTATTLYTFTPTIGQCATTSTTTIVVNPLPNGNVAGGTSVLQNSGPTAITFTGSNGIAPYTFTYNINGGINQTITTTVGNSVSISIPSLVPGNYNINLISVQDTNTPFCISSLSAFTTVIVIPIPSATITGTTSVCENNSSPTIVFTCLNGMPPYIFTYTINGGLNQTTPPSIGNIYTISVPTNATGIFNYNLVSVQDANSTQFQTGSVTINVLTAPIINTPLPYDVCDDNNDGISCFDLTLITPQVTSDLTLIVTYHETLTDSQTGGNPLASPYCNINANTQTIYIRVFNPAAPLCYALTTVQLIIHPVPVATTPQDYHECDDNFDGFAIFDLSSINSEVLGSISAATHLVTYHTSLLDAQNGVSAISNILNYTNSIINTQTLWIRVETTATGCYDIVTLQLVVDPLPQSTQPAYAPYSLCDITSPLGYEAFDLQSQEAAILLGQLGMSVTFYPSLAQAQSQINAIPSGLYTNISPFVQTLGVVITNTATGCNVISTMDIRVEPLPTPIPPLQPYTVCDTDQDGFSQFDLCTLTAAINVGGYLISYHETQPDAQLGNNPLACIYNNIFSFTQIIWVRAQDVLTQCVSTMPIVLQVDASPILPILIPNLILCDQDSNNQNGITAFDLTQQTAVILSAQTSAGINYSVTYYNSQIAAQSGVGNIVNTTTYQGFDTQVIWIRVEHTTTGCFAIGSFTLEVNIPLLLTTPPPLGVCDNDANPNDLFTTFDLSVRDNLITTGLAGYTVSYYPSWPVTVTSVAITTPTGYINVSPAVQTLGVEVTSPNGCKSYTTLDIRVLPVPTPLTNPPVLASQCENALDSGVQSIDITVNAAYIINNDPNVTLHYYHSLSDATSIPPINEILTPTAALIGDPSLLNVTPRPLNLVQNVYVVVSSNLFIDFNSQNCYTVVEQPFIINPLPIVVAIGAQQICEADPTGNDGFEIFDLTSYNADLLLGNATVPASNYTVAFYTDASLTNQIATSSAYTNLTNPQTVYAQVTNTITGCSNSQAFDIIVNPKPLLTPPLDFSSCDDELNDNDGFYLYPLDLLIPGILNGQSPGNFTVSFYHSQADADANPPVNAISDLANYQSQSERIWIRVENNTTGCYQIGSFDIIIEQYATPVIETVDGINTICVNFITSEVERSLTLFASNATVYLADPQPSYDYQWFIDGVAIPGAVSPGYVIDTPLPNNESAVYTVSMTTTGSLGCTTTSESFTVLQSGPAVVAVGTVGYTVTNAFTENQIITVIVEGWGTYQYSLDDGPRQESPIFTNVSLGSHLITVWDSEGGLDFSCDALVIELIQTIDYPLYFTPNGDGIHDTWNIVGLEGEPSTKIYIFDRFGKLIKQISSTGDGWDGTYNGQQLPSTDYWFTVDYNEQEVQKQFKAHFTLKR